MDVISNNIQLLLVSIKESEEYLEYKRQEERLEAMPELKERTDKFRGNNFRLQNDPSHEDLFERAEKLARESAELRRIPEVNAYLDAELALCKLLQKVCRTLIEGIDIQVPDF